MIPYVEYAVPAAINEDNEPVTLSDFINKKIVLVFYPFDFSGICQGELCEIRDNYNSWIENGAIVFGIPALSLAVSEMFILLMSGLILFQTSQILHGGETNYVMATITLYIAIYNLFLSLLQILGIFGGED